MCGRRSGRALVEEEREDQRTCVDVGRGMPERLLELRYRLARPGVAPADDDVELSAGLAFLPRPLANFG